MGQKPIDCISSPTCGELEGGRRGFRAAGCIEAALPGDTKSGMIYESRVIAVNFLLPRP